jgi:hypothetical protein
MTRSRVPIVGALLLLAAVAGNALSQGTDQAGAFVKNLVEAINSKSLDRRKALVHPKSLACATAEPDSFYHAMVTRQARNTVPVNYKWKITPVPPDQPLMFEDKFDYPIRPTHALQLDFETGPTRGVTMILQIVYDAKRWHEVIACPKPETIAAGQAAGQAKAKRTERVQALVAKIPPQLKERVMELLKQGRRVDAIKHYQNGSGEDLTTAVEVVDMLASQGR